MPYLPFGMPLASHAQIVSHDFSWLRRTLDSAAYTAEAIGKIDGFKTSGRAMDLGLALRATEEPTPFNLAVRLFLLGRPVPGAQAESLLTARGITELASLGVLRTGADEVHAEVGVQPLDGLLTVRDFGPDVTGKQVS